MSRVEGISSAGQEINGVKSLRGVHPPGGAQVVLVRGPDVAGRNETGLLELLPCRQLLLPAPAFFLQAFKAVKNIPACHEESAVSIEILAVRSVLFAGPGLVAEFLRWGSGGCFPRDWCIPAPVCFRTEKRRSACKTREDLVLTKVLSQRPELSRAEKPRIFLSSKSPGRAWWGSSRG